MKIDSLRLLIQAGNPIISMQTPDELRAVELVREVAGQMSLPLVEWSLTEGLVEWCPPGKQLVGPGRLPQALELVKQTSSASLYLFKDLGPHCRDPMVVRHLRDLYFSPDSRLWNMVLVEALGLPPELRRLTVPFDIGWPDEQELTEVVRSTFQEAKRRSLSQVEARLTQRELEQLVQMLRGLTTQEAARLVSAAIHDDGVLDGADCRESWRPSGPGWERWAAWNRSPPTSLRRTLAGCGTSSAGSTCGARVFPPGPASSASMPREGCSYWACKAAARVSVRRVVASAWRMPLLRMDPGVLYQKFIGESEARLREALQQAESMAPVVLWIDEIEKAFASASSDSADGGLSQRMFGSLLTWMQDHRRRSSSSPRPTTSASFRRS